MVQGTSSSSVLKNGSKQSCVSVQRIEKILNKFKLQFSFDFFKVKESSAYELT